MKKKYLLLLLIPALLLVITGCGKEEKNEKKESQTKTIELADSKLGFKTTFTVDKNANYTDIEVDKESGASAELEFKNDDLDLEFEMYYNTMRTATYNDSKETRSAQKYYKEYKFGKYEAYAYGEYGSGLYLNILLDVEDNDMADVLFVSIDREDSNEDIIVADVVADKEVQKLFNSMKFEKTK